MMKRKGVSPLVTTVLLTSFVVVSVIVVTLWGKGVQKDLQGKQGGIATASLECTGVAFDVVGTAGGSITLENRGPDLDGVLLVVKGDGTSQTQLYKQVVQRGGSRSFPYAGVPGVGEVEEVTVVAAMGKGIYRPCTEQRVDVVV